MEYNAGKKEDGSTHAMIHERLLRSARQPCNTRGVRRDAAEWDEMTDKLKGLKPDVIIYEGVRQEKLRQFLEGAERPCPGFKIHILEVGYCNDWNWETKLAEKREAYRCLVARMKKCGWKVVYKQVALGTRGGKGGGSGCHRRRQHQAAVGVARPAPETDRSMRVNECG